MLLRTAAAAAVVVVSVLGLGASLLSTPVARGVGPGSEPLPTFEIDRVHSTLLYHVRHFGVSNFHGRINLPTGSFRFDADDLAGSSLSAVAEIKNMDTGKRDRDRFLLSPDFFNAREYPTAEFRSSSIRVTPDGAYEALGEFTMHGVTRAVTTKIENLTTLRTVKFGLRTGFQCTFTVKRSDFGMDLFVEEGTLGDEVTITASIEGVYRPEE